MGWIVILRGIRHRPGRSLIVLLLAAIATASMVLAPAYTRAAQQSVLTDRLATAPLSVTSLQVRSDSVTGEAPALESTDEAKLELRQLLSRRPGLASHLARPTAGADVDTVATVAGATVLARLAYRDGACANVTMTAGTCADGPGTVIMSERSAQEHSVTVGQSLTVRGRVLAGPAASDPAKARSLRVVGLYTPTDAKNAYWGRGGYFAAGAADSEASLPRVDAIFVGDEQDLTLPGAFPSVLLDYALVTSTIRLDDVAPLRTALTGFETEVNAGQLQLLTALRGALDDIDEEAAALSRTVPIVAVPLVLVCWFILFLLVAALTEERAPEVALAKLRGFSLGQAARFGRGEAAFLVVLAAPLGVLGGLGIVELAARSTLAPQVHVEPRWPVLAAALVALVAALLAVRLASGRALARPVLALLRRVPERARPTAGIVEAVAVALAGASLVAALSDQTAPLALLAPALIALVAGIVTARLLGLWSRARVRRHLTKGRISGVLAHAQLSRRRLGDRVMLVVTVAVALLSFAATAWDVAAQARDDVAADTVGAERVVLVSAADPVAFVAAVDSAGAAAGTAMPVVRVSERYRGEVVELLGIRSADLADVAVWRGVSRAEVARVADRLRPDEIAPLAVDDFVRVELSAAGLTGGPHLAAVVASAGDPVRTVDLGRIRSGRHEYRATVPGCANGCRLVGLALTRVGTDDSMVRARLTVASIGTRSGVLPAGFEAIGRWRVDSPQTGSEVRPGTALEVTVATNDPGDIVVSYVDTPAVLPVVLAGPTPADDPAAAQFSFPALADGPQRFTVVERPATLPRVGTEGLLFDLDYAVRSAQRSSSLSDNSRLRYEVWAGRDAPVDLAGRLAAAGLQVFGEESLEAERDRLARGAPALGLRLYLLAGGAAVVLAVGTVLLTAYIGAAARRYEFAALRVAGVPPRFLRRGLLREQAHLIGVPLVMGLLAGVAGAVLMLPGIPLVTAGTAVGEISYDPGGLTVLPVVVAAMVGGLLLAALVVLRQVGRGTPDRLREGGIA